MTQPSLRRTLQGAGLVAASTVAGLLLEYVARQRIASTLGPEGYGKVYLAMSGAYVLAKAAQVGTGPGVKRFASLHLAAGEAGLAVAYVRTGIGVTFLVAVVLAALVHANAPAVASALLGAADEARLVSTAAWAIPGLALLEVVQNALLAFRRTAHAVAVTPFSDKALALALLLPAIAVAPSAETCLGGLVAAATLASVAGCWVAGRTVRRGGAAPGSRARVTGSLLAFSWPLQVAGVSTLLLHRLDATLVGAFASAREAGYVHAALPLAELSLIGFTGIVAVLAPPFMGYVARGDLGGLRGFYLRVQAWSLYVTGPCVAFMLAFPADLLSTLYSPAFVPAAPLLRVLSLGFLVAAASGPCGAALIAVGKARASMAATLAGLAALCLLDAALLPRLGVRAIGIARIGGFLAFYGVGLVALRSSLGPLVEASRVARSVACVLVAAAGGAWVSGPLGALPGPVRIALGGVFVLALFAAAAFVLGLVSAEDRARLSRALGRQRARPTTEVTWTS